MRNLLDFFEACDDSIYLTRNGLGVTVNTDSRYNLLGDVHVKLPSGFPLVHRTAFFFGGCSPGFRAGAVLVHQIRIAKVP
jgi:hypothetical protein